MRLWGKLAVVSALLTVGLMAGGRAAHAQTPVNPLLPTTGTREIGLSGNFIFEPDDSQDISVLYGPFLNPNLQVGGRVDYFNPSAGDDVIGAELFANWHFPGASAALPYIGIGVGYIDTGNDDAFSYGVQGGVKYFLDDNISVNGELVFRDSDSEGADSDLRLRFGLSVYLR